MKHKNIEIQPCSNDWSAMEARPNGNRFCHSCSKVIHDFSEMTAEDLKVFMKANPGTCGKFLKGQIKIAQTRAPFESQIKRNVRAASWKKAAAAAAALMLLHGQLPAESTISPVNYAEANRTTHDSGPSENKSGPSTNTMLTGVVVDQRGNLISDPIILKIYRGSVLITEPILLHQGLFSVDLAGKAAPSDRLSIVVKKQTVEGVKFAKTITRTLLGEGQNLRVVSEVTYRPVHIYGFINEI